MEEDRYKQNRIKLRLSETTKRQLEYLKDFRGIHASDILETATERLYNEMLEKDRLENDKYRRKKEIEHVLEMLEKNVNEDEIRSQIRYIYSTF